MSHLREPSSESASASGDSGFTLVEIIVALGVMLTVMVAVLPQLVVGLRSAGTARLVAQGELERMRGMPYNVGPSAGPYVDVLDIYYPDLTPPTATPVCGPSDAFNQPQASWTGYVPTGGTRCSYEPQNGAFYRSVRPAVSTPGLGPFVVVTATQFLSADLPPVAATPPAGYNTLYDATDVPPEAQIGVTVTVRAWKAAPDHDLHPDPPPRFQRGAPARGG